MAVAGVAAPTPARLALCGLPVALSVTVMRPPRFPEAVGVKVTLMVQAPPAIMDAPQLLVCAKSPLARMLVKVKVALPGLDRLMFCAADVVPVGWLAKDKLSGLNTTAGPFCRPVPDRFT